MPSSLTHWAPVTNPEEILSSLAMDKHQNPREIKRSLDFPGIFITVSSVLLFTAFYFFQSKIRVPKSCRR